MAKPMPTLADVAAEADVSLATASRVLGGSRDRVSDVLAARVEQVARALHYVPNAHAQALARSSSATTGLVVHDVSDPYFAEIARGVLREASQHDHLVMICNAFRDADREVDYVAALRSQRVHSILLAGSGYVDPAIEQRLGNELRAFRQAEGRVATIGRRDLGVDAVQPDHVGGARAVAAHLVDLGHRRFGVLAGPAALITIRERLEGFRTELARNGHRLAEADVCHADFTRAGGHRAALELLDRAPDVTAVFALNDAMAIGALAAYRDRGIAVPETISLAGFDDIPQAVDVARPLTTVRLPMEEFGRNLVQLTQAREPDDARDVVVIDTDSELVVRQSTSRPQH